MAKKRDYYEILEINKDADESTIKKAYRRLAKKYHPDTNTENSKAEQEFKEITEAYTILGNPEKKNLYDQYGHMAFEGGFDPEAARAGAYNSSDGGYREYHFEGDNMDDMFQDIFGGIFHGGKSGGFNYQNSSQNGSGFRKENFGQESFGQEHFRQESRRRKGADLHTDVSVSFDEAVWGCDKIICLQSADDMTGTSQSLQIHIPAGIGTGKSIRLRSKGMPGYRGGQPGDLLLKVTVGEKPGFKRKGMDVYTTASIPFTTAVLGGETMVQTLYGNVMCKIKEGTQSGTKIRLKGKGIVSMKDSNLYGDQYVTIQIQVPTNLTQQARQSLREFELASNPASSRLHKNHAE